MENDIYEEMNKIYESKKEKLLHIIESYVKNDVIVAFTGGVGSSLLLSLFEEIKHSRYGKVYAITVKTMFKPTYDIAIARKVANELSATHSVIAIDDEHYQKELMYNPKNRCYICKTMIFDKLSELAQELEVPTIVEGTNYADYHGTRPGNQAIIEYGIKSPFVEAGFTKENVIRLAKERNISVAEKPDSPCFATRFPYDTRLDLDMMKNVQQCEEYVKTLGINYIRIRIHDHLARIEVKPEDFQRLLTHREDISEYLKNHGFHYISMDLLGYQSGSMDVNYDMDRNRRITN